MPRSLRDTLQVVLALLLALGTLAVLQPPGSTAESGVVRADRPGFSHRIVDERAFRIRLDELRARHGLPPLAVADDLRQLARTHSGRMTDTRTLFHNPSLTSDVCCWRSVSETVGTGPSVAGIHDRLVNSALHRDILLDPDMNQVGIGVAHENGMIYVTHVLRQR